MTGPDTNNNNLALRENLIKTAVKFLQNPNVAASPLVRKLEFLRRKGLTDEEIRAACEISNVRNDQHIPHDINEHAIVPIPQNQTLYCQHHLDEPSVFQKLKEFFNVTAFLGATIYCVYWFYKKFVRPLIFGHDKKTTVQDSVSELDKSIKNSMNEVRDSILKVKSDVQKLSYNQTLDPSIPQLVQELKQDLSSLKALLLSRKQFPTAPASIPSWQLDSTNSSQEKTAEREDDAGSGSSANNSDSSLEMIREDPPKFELSSNSALPPP